MLIRRCFSQWKDLNILVIPAGFEPVLYSRSRRLDQLDQGNNILKVLDRLRIWPTFLTLPFVGKRDSHSRLSCSQDRHQFQWPLAHSCGKLNRFPFSTFFLAGFRDCSLLELHVLVLSHISPCELHACSYCRTISRFWLYRRVHFGFNL